LSGVEPLRGKAKRSSGILVKTNMEVPFSIPIQRNGESVAGLKELTWQDKLPLSAEAEAIICGIIS